MKRNDIGDSYVLGCSSGSLRRGECIHPRGRLRRPMLASTNPVDGASAPHLLTRFCLSCGIANAPDRHPDGFGPITNREKDDSTITEPLRPNFFGGSGAQRSNISGLDPEARRRLADRIRGVARAQGAVMLLDQAGMDMPEGRSDDD